MGAEVAAKSLGVDCCRVQVREGGGQDEGQGGGEAEMQVGAISSLASLSPVLSPPPFLNYFT